MTGPHPDFSYCLAIFLASKRASSTAVWSALSQGPSVTPGFLGMRVGRD